MGEDGKGCWKSLAIGCGTAFLVGVGVLLLMTVSIVAPMRRAGAARVKLDAGFDSQESFTPAASGKIDPERLERFIAVRQDLRASCVEFTAADDEFRKIEALDERQDVEALEALQQAMKTTRAAMGIGPLMGEFFELRNRSLLDHGMGLGEFSYLYATAYNRQLARERPDGGIFDDEPVNARMRTALRAMVERQRSAAAASGQDESWLQVLDDELVRLAEDSSRVPWQDGLPPPTANSLAQYGDALDALYCDAMAPTELLINRRRAMAYETY